MARGNSFEGGSDETTLTTGNSGGTSGNAFDSVSAGTGATLVFDNAQAAPSLGSFSLRTATGGTSALAYAAWTLASVTSDYARGYFRFTSLPGAQQLIIRYLSGGSQSLRVNVKTDGAIEVRNAANSVVGTTTNTISAGSWFRVEIFTTFSTTVGAVTLRLYLSANGTSITETLNLTSLVLTASSNELRWGVGAATSNAVAVWIDNVATEGTTWFGPALVTGAGARATTFGTAAAGTRTVLGSAARTTTFATTAAGVKTVLGTASRATTFGISATGVRETSGTGTRTTTFTTAAEGIREVLGTAPLAATFATTAEGGRTVLGTGRHAITFATAAEGGPVIEYQPTAVLVASVSAPAYNATAAEPALVAGITTSTHTASV